jgi:hypothetical protein
MTQRAPGKKSERFNYYQYYNRNERNHRHFVQPSVVNMAALIALMLEIQH